MNSKLLSFRPTSLFPLALAAFLATVLGTPPAGAQANTVSVRTVTYAWTLTRTTTSPTAGPGMMPEAITMTVLPGQCVPLVFTVTATRKIVSTVNTPCGPGQICPASPTIKTVNACAVLTDIAQPGGLSPGLYSDLSFAFTGTAANPAPNPVTYTLDKSTTLTYFGTLCLSAATPCGQHFTWDNFAHLVGCDNGTVPSDTWSPFWVEVYTGDCSPLPLCTYTQGGYGNRGNPYQVMAANFPSAAGFTIGSGSNTLSFTTAKAVQDYLPAGGKPAALPNAGVFGGQVLTLTINVYLSNGNGTPSGFGSLVFCNSGAALNGIPVAQVLQDANTALGGGPLPSYVTNISQLSDLVTNLNEAFDDCTATGWATTHLCAPKP